MLRILNQPPAPPAPSRPVPRLTNTLTWHDYLGMMCVRLGIGRDRYRVAPGLYALGAPSPAAPVLVTANYKLTVDVVRAALADHDAWLLVLDTRGINVWCAAGKGTFGTDELVRRIACVGLGSVVTHRELIVPQLAGPGVAAHEVKKRSGWKVVFGPVRIADLPAFLTNGRVATPSMRRVRFTLTDRLALAPMELIGGWHVYLGAALLLPLIAMAQGRLEWTAMLASARVHGSNFIVAVLAGAALTPMLLPWLPGRAFAMKGFVLGLALVALNLARLGPVSFGQALASVLLWPAVSAFVAMNFTGASTYTSLSGVQKEMRYAVPAEIGVATLGTLVALLTR